jgi:hypothetical protein
MTRRIAHFIAEHQNISKLLRTRKSDHEVERMQEDSQTSRAPALDKDAVLLSSPMK